MTSVVSRRLDTGDVSLHLRERGEGPAVVLLHGFPDTLDTFDDLAERLAANGRRAIQVAMRGYAPSSLSRSGAYDALTLGRDVLRVIDDTGGPAAIVGHDWGAVAAYSAAQQAPERIGHLVTAAVPHPRRFLRASARQLRRSWYMGYFQLRGRPDAAVQQGDLITRLWHDWSPGLEPDGRHMQAIHDNFADPGRASAALAYYRAMPGTILRSLRPAQRALLAPVTVPTTMVAGELDGCIGPEMFSGQERLFPAGLRLEVLGGAGHFMHLEQPDAFARLVLEALTGP